MVKLLSKKTSQETFRTLNEREIQERLYGRYHRDQAPPARHEHLGPLAVQDHSQVKDAKRASLSEGLSAFLKAGRVGLSNVVRRFPWKFAVGVSASLALVIVLFQFISFSFARLNTASSASKVLVEQELRTPISSPAQMAKTESPRVVPVSPTVFSATQVQTPAKQIIPSTVVPKQKFYAVQVCTYQRESDAQQLTEELKKLNFPAFYKQFLSPQQRIPHFVVFLSREETYAEANVKLNEFRRTKHFLTFSDSFIRSL